MRVWSVVAMTEHKVTGLGRETDPVSVDIEVEGEHEDMVEKVFMHAKDEAVRAIQAYQNGELPEDCEGLGYSVKWESVTGDTDE